MKSAPTGDEAGSMTSSVPTSKNVYVVIRKTDHKSRESANNY